MRFEELLAAVGNEPVFETGLLLAGPVDANDVRRQLSRWVCAGRLLQIRRGLYCLAALHRKVSPQPFLVANRLVRGSYVSLQSALAHAGLIPEAVPLVTSVTTGRPGRRDTPLGSFLYRHIDMKYFGGYRCLELERGQSAFVASPHKALLELLYLEPGSDDSAYLEELRLQGLDRLRTGELRREAARFHSPKLDRAVEAVESLARREAEEYQPL